MLFAMLATSLCTSKASRFRSEFMCLILCMRSLTALAANLTTLDRIQVSKATLLNNDNILLIAHNIFSQVLLFRFHECNSMPTYFFSLYFSFAASQLSFAAFFVASQAS